MTVTTLARHTDRATAKEAGRLAEATAQLIEDWVLIQFHEVGAEGLTDHDLVKRYAKAQQTNPTMTPSGEWETARKRRSSLTRKRLVLATNRTRKGVRSQSTVWVHRDYLTPKGTAA